MFRKAKKNRESLFTLLAKQCRSHFNLTNIIFDRKNFKILIWRRFEIFIKTSHLKLAGTPCTCACNAEDPVSSRIWPGADCSVQWQQCYRFRPICVQVEWSEGCQCSFRIPASDCLPCNGRGVHQLCEKSFQCPGDTLECQRGRRTSPYCKPLWPIGGNCTERCLGDQW